MKEKEEKALKKVKADKKSTEFLQKFKKRWLISGINTLLLIAILVAAFVLINIGMKKWDPTAIDVTKSQDYTLTDESKQRIKNIDKEVNIYFIGYEETSSDYIVAKQYNKTNSKIKVEIISATDAAAKFKEQSISTETPSILIKSGNTFRTIDYYDTMTYDDSYNSVSIAEQKITSAILNVTTDKTPKAYYLTGYTSLSFEKGLSYLAQYLDNEVLTYEELNILSKKEVPEDCDTLIIMTPEKDFDELTTNAIINYIKKGGNILWFNGVIIEDENYTNVNKVLAQYGIDSFKTGYIYESDKDKYYYQTNALFKPEIQNTEVTKNVYKAMGGIFFLATKVNVNTDKLEELKVKETDLILSSETAYYINDLNRTTVNKDDKKGSFVVGALMEKTVKENTAKENEEDNSVVSKLIIYGNDYFITDSQLSQEIAPMIMLENNRDLVLNSLSYLNNRDVDITIRKSYSDSVTTFSPTDGEKAVIIAIIFAVPVLIIIAGIIVWVIRKHRN